MRFLIRLANQRNYTSNDARKLALSAYEVLREFGADVGNLRVSHTAVELDLLLASRSNLQAATTVLEKELGRLLSVRELDTAPVLIGEDEALREGIRFFNEERYWESHEALEAAWRKAAGPEKEVLQGLILVAASFVHLQKNEDAVAVGVMRRAHEKLSLHHGEHFGIDIDRLSTKLSEMLSDGHLDFFEIRAKPYSSRAAA
jgi:hypothetical protein